MKLLCEYSTGAYRKFAGILASKSVQRRWDQGFWVPKQDQTRSIKFNSHSLWETSVFRKRFKRVEASRKASFCNCWRSKSSLICHRCSQTAKTSASPPPTIQHYPCLQRTCLLVPTNFVHRTPKFSRRLPNSKMLKRNWAKDLDWRERWLVLQRR